MPGFRESVSGFAKVTKERLDQQVRKITLDLFSDIIMNSPVGNPEKWAVNGSAVRYNEQVSEHNAALLEDPANLTKKGRLKPGKKLNDGMNIVGPAGYVGGRFRGNWQTSISAPVSGVVDRIDPTGQAAVGEASANMGGAGTVTYLVNNLPYAQALEYDAHSSQAPAGMVRVAMARITQNIPSIIRR
ncbi:hypothetical protein [Xylophilus sp.]|uniref:hypothetical protein n=1 Tax=Xylophilus sp. TaxID=2653893 RepID=UPI0013BBC3AA|nr:hypothetical protein [Xylophilus sp.]KAF1045608.1 MAG: hypothetical protein GAK38_02900 [Xylophilus sp.]